VSEGLKLNVALSRSTDQFIFVGDVNALEPNEYHQRQLDEMEPDDREAREII